MTKTVSASVPYGVESGNCIKGAMNKKKSLDLKEFLNKFLEN